MKPTAWVATGLVVAIVGVGAYGITNADDRMKRSASDESGISEYFNLAHYRDRDRRGRGRGYGMRNGAFMQERFCESSDGRFVNFVLGHVEDRIKPTDAQTEAWNGVKSAFDQAETKTRGAICADEAKIKDEASSVERLAQAETMLTTALDAVKTVRPSIETFYATLSDEQKETLDEMRPRRGRGGHHGRRHRHWD